MIAGVLYQYSNHDLRRIWFSRSLPDFKFIKKERVEMKSGIAVFMHQEWSIQAALLSAFHRLRK